MNEPQLTGRVRHRQGPSVSRFQSVTTLVLQVEVAVPEHRGDEFRQGHGAHTQWRDATVLDLQQLKITGELHAGN